MLHSTSNTAAAMARSPSDHCSVCGRDGGEQRVALTLPGRGERRVVGRAGLERERRHELEDLGREPLEVVERELVEVDARLLLELGHHRVAQGPLVGEVAVDRALVDAGALRRRRAP